MTEQKTGRWAQIRAQTLETPERRAQYERTKRQVLATRRVLQHIEAERKRRRISKAELAHRIGMSPSIVRRLLSSHESNPGFGTVIVLLEALDLEVALHRGDATTPAERELALV
ncbi:MAG TPA: helix-turn-helix transcriptional regulator [Chloroflexota bacterium]|jgi:ribosome-binding protein aMBF1 (putative translation factor)